MYGILVLYLLAISVICSFRINRENGRVLKLPSRKKLVSDITLLFYFGFFNVFFINYNKKTVVVSYLLIFMIIVVKKILLDLKNVKEFRKTLKEWFKTREGDYIEYILLMSIYICQAILFLFAIKWIFDVVNANVVYTDNLGNLQGIVYGIKIFYQEWNLNIDFYTKIGIVLCDIGTICTLWRTLINFNEMSINRNENKNYERIIGYLTKNKELNM